jgi:transcriptional regulator with XRE-family HTH domain
LGITRCIAVSGVTWHIDPNRPIPTAAGSAVVSDDELANLENGRGNPTVTALTRLAEALGMRLVVTPVPGEESQQASATASPEMPDSLVRLGRTPRFRQAVRELATTLDLDAYEFSRHLVAALAMIARTMGRDHGNWPSAQPLMPSMTSAVVSTSA